MTVKYSEEELQKYMDKFSGEEKIFLTRHQDISEGFIERNKDKVCWLVISTEKKLSEPFMERNLVNSFFWDKISRHQQLSEGFMLKHENKLNWSLLIMFQRFSPQFAINVGWTDYDCMRRIKNNCVMTDDEKNNIIENVKIVSKLV